MADQNPDKSPSDSSSDNSQASSAASESQPGNEYEIATTRSTRFGGGTGSSLQLNENFTRQRVTNQQHQGRTTQSQSHSQDLAYSAQQRLTEFMNANRAAEPHLRQASSYRLFASSNSGSQHNNQIEIAYDAWDNSSNLNPGASNVFARGTSSNRHASGGSSLSRRHGTVMQQASNQDRIIQTYIQSPDPVLPPLVSVNMIPTNTHITLITATSPDMPRQIHFEQDMPTFVPGDVDTILAELQAPSVHGPNLPIDVTDFFAVPTDMQGHSAHGQHFPEVSLSDLHTGPANWQMHFAAGRIISRASPVADMWAPSVHGPNLPIDVTDPFAVPTDMQGHSVHGQHFPEVSLSDLHTSPANWQMHFAAGQNISRASPVAVSRNLISLQRPLHGQSSSVVVPRDRRIPTNVQRPPVSGQNLSGAVVLKDTDKTLIGEQGCNHQGESSSNAVPRDSKKLSIYVPKPSAHGQGLFNPLPADTNAFTRGSMAKSPIATEGQTSFSPFAGRTNAFARGSAAKSSIATQGQTSFIPFAGRTNAFARGSAAKSSIATQGQTSFIPFAGRTNAFARGSVAKSSIATQGATSSQEDINASARGSMAKSSIATQGATSSQEDINASARGSMAKSSIATQGQTSFIPFAGRTNAFARGSVAKSSIATQGATSSQEDINAFARGSMAKSSIATQGQTSFIPFAGRTNAFARGSAAKSSIATQGLTLSPGQFIPLPADTNALARGSVAKSSSTAQGQTSSRGGTFARESAAKTSIATQRETSLQPQSKRIKTNSEDGRNLAVEQSTKLESSMRFQSSAAAKNKSSPPLVPTPQEPSHHIRTQEGAEFALIGEKCQLCNIDLAFYPTGSTSSSSHNNTILPISACLPCGHCYHYDCMKGVYGSPGKGEVPPCFRCSEDVPPSDD